MTKVNIIEKLNTTLGKVLVVNNTAIYKVGQVVIDNEGNEYYIHRVVMPTTPDNSNVALIVG